MLLANSLASQNLEFAFFSRHCRDTSFCAIHRPRCLTLIDTRATESTGLHRGQAATWKPAFICKQPAGRDKSLSCNCTLLHSVTDVQPWSSSRVWAGIWVTSECAHTAPPSEGGASGLHSRCPGSTVQMWASCPSPSTGWGFNEVYSWSSELPGMKRKLFGGVFPLQGSLHSNPTTTASFKYRSNQNVH